MDSLSKKVYVVVDVAVVLLDVVEVVVVCVVVVDVVVDVVVKKLKDLGNASKPPTLPPTRV